MSTPEHMKRRKMSSIHNHETTTMTRRYSPRHKVAAAAQTAAAPASLAPRIPLTQQAKQMAMSAVNSVETATQLGVMRTAAIAGVYYARIREADRPNRMQKQREAKPAHWSQTQRDRSGREL